MSEKKRKGGAEKLRENKKKQLQNDAKMCLNIQDMFTKPKVSIYLFTNIFYLFKWFLSGLLYSITLLPRVISYY